LSDLSTSTCIVFFEKNLRHAFSKLTLWSFNSCFFFATGIFFLPSANYFNFNAFSSTVFLTANKISQANFITFPIIDYCNYFNQLVSSYSTGATSSASLSFEASIKLENTIKKLKPVSIIKEHLSIIFFSLFFVHAFIRNFFVKM